MDTEDNIYSKFTDQLYFDNLGQMPQTLADNSMLGSGRNFTHWEAESAVAALDVKLNGPNLLDGHVYQNSAVASDVLFDNHKVFDTEAAYFSANWNRVIGSDNNFAQWKVESAVTNLTAKLNESYPLANDVLDPTDALSVAINSQDTVSPVATVFESGHSISDSDHNFYQWNTEYTTTELSAELNDANRLARDVHLNPADTLSVATTSQNAFSTEGVALLADNSVLGSGRNFTRWEAESAAAALNAKLNGPNLLDGNVHQNPAVATDVLCDNHKAFDTETVGSSANWNRVIGSDNDFGQWEAEADVTNLTAKLNESYPLINDIYLNAKLDISSSLLEEAEKRLDHGGLSYKELDLCTQDNRTEPLSLRSKNEVEGLIKKVIPKEVGKIKYTVSHSKDGNNYNLNINIFTNSVSVGKGELQFGHTFQ